ncbi:hypothetical protein R1K95_31045 [Pseudomonas aeruginosa]|nr:hypothetical protein R1K95_31045 [Pseudomonas aeruginosa]
MIVHTDPDWSAWDLPRLQASQFSARQTLIGIAPYLERFHSGREGLQEFQVDGLLFYPLELIKGVLVLSPQWPRRLTACLVAGAGESAARVFEFMIRR